jgi:hypothetical protein
MFVTDETSTIKVMIFNDSLEECENLNAGLPKEDDIVICKGKKKGEDVVFASLISIQKNKIFTKLTDLVKKED